MEISIEYEHHVVGRKRLRKRCKIADVAEEHGDCFAFPAAPESLLCELTCYLEISLVQDEAAQFHIAAQSCLTSKTDLRPKTKLHGERFFVFAPLLAPFEAFQDPDPARGTLRMAAASVSVRNAGAQGPLKNRLSWTELELALIRKADDFRHMN